MSLIDSHCHLDFADFEHDLAHVLSSARGRGVTKFIVPGVMADRWQRQIAMAKQWGLHYALGMHPCFMQSHLPEHVACLDALLASEQAVAVGEIGLDAFIPNADLNAQQSLLDAQLNLAKSHNLPVILHVRKAHDQMLKTLRQVKLAQGGVVHAYSGSLQQAEQYIALGFKLGIGGTVTYPRANKLRKIVASLPLDACLLETDAPDMPLCGYQGERNLPERVVNVAEVLAELKGCHVTEVARMTKQSTAKLFKL
ncbi:MAG: TatD family hydrolase [Pontibacterium sp.]